MIWLRLVQRSTFNWARLHYISEEYSQRQWLACVDRIFAPCWLVMGRTEASVRLDSFLLDMTLCFDWRTSGAPDCAVTSTPGPVPPRQQPTTKVLAKFGETARWQAGSRSFHSHQVSIRSPPGSKRKSEIFVIDRQHQHSGPSLFLRVLFHASRLPSTVRPFDRFCARSVDPHGIFHFSLCCWIKFPRCGGPLTVPISLHPSNNRYTAHPSTSIRPDLLLSAQLEMPSTLRPGYPLWSRRPTLQNNRSQLS